MADEQRETQQPEAQPDPAPPPDPAPQPAPRGSLYRQRAYEQRGRVAPIDGVLRVSSPHEWLMLLALAATVIAVLAWSIVGRLESGVSAPCTLHAPGARHLVVAPSAGVVVEVMAEPGDEVDAGDPLARLAAPELSIAADLAVARAAALAAEHPGDAETVAAAAEAETLAELETAGTLVVSPASGQLAVSGLRVGVALEAGAAAAEVRQAGTGPPTAVVSLGSDAALVRPGSTASVAVTVAGAADAVIADARIATVGGSQSQFALPGALDDRSAAGNAASAAMIGDAGASAHLGAAQAAAEFVTPPPAEFAAVAELPGSAYECTARIVTGSHRPIERLIGRR